MRLIFWGLLVSSVLIAGCESDTGMDTYAPVVRLGVGPKQAPSVYVVKPGDTLYGISWTYGIDDTEIVRVNHIGPPFEVRVGQQLFLRQTAALSQAEYAVTPSAAAVSGWIWPVKGPVIRRFTPGLTGNAGIDVTGYLGQPIRASQGGVVVYSGDGVRGYGNLIIVKEGSHYLSAYAFNQKNLVRVGEDIQKGQNIAAMGQDNTGVPALHFEIRLDGKPVDPLRYLQ